jgi:hypothetical protein
MPKKLKRSSLLPNEIVRRRRSAENDWTIKPAEPFYPCPIATLPTEIREQIYSYLLPSCAIAIERLRYSSGWVCKPLFRTCRRIRAEIAYLLYSRAEFKYVAGNLSFDCLKTWLQSLPAEHRAYLAKNRRLSIGFSIYNRLPEANSNEAWALCRRFGNLFAIDGSTHKNHFISFAKLADWFLFCGQPAFANIKWNYTFEWRRAVFPWLIEEWNLEVLKDHLGVFNLPCVIKHASLPEEEKVQVRKEALRMMEGLDKAWDSSAKTSGNYDPEALAEWKKRMTSLTAFLEGW